MPGVPNGTATGAITRLTSIWMPSLKLCRTCGCSINSMPRSTMITLSGWCLAAITGRTPTRSARPLCISPSRPGPTQRNDCCGARDNLPRIYAANARRSPGYPLRRRCSLLPGVSVAHRQLHSLYASRHAPRRVLLRPRPGLAGRSAPTAGAGAGGERLNFNLVIVMKTRIGGRATPIVRFIDNCEPSDRNRKCLTPTDPDQEACGLTALARPACNAAVPTFAGRPGPSAHPAAVDTAIDGCAPRDHPPVGGM